jgi:glucose/arabinose dehydrogenase
VIIQYDLEVFMTGRKLKAFICGSLLTLVGAVQAVDVSITLGDSSFSGYLLNSFSPADAAVGAIGALNPSLKLVYHKRYEITVVNYGSHPVEILAKATSAASDGVLLSMATGITGSLESDSDIQWEDTGTGTVRFTLTPKLYSAMTAGGLAPGYRCQVHASTMRGNFVVVGEPVINPIPASISKSPTRVELQPVATGLAAPIRLVEPADGSGRLLILDQKGTIEILQNGQLLSPPMLDISARLVQPLGIIGTHDANDYDERGLLGIALHPDFAHSGQPGFHTLYTFTSEPVSGTADFTTPPLPAGVVHDHQDVIAEWSIDSGNPNLVDPTSRREVIRIDHPQFNHNSGEMVFGPDGYLYIGLGDGGAANDVGDGHPAIGNGQNINRILGSIIRIDPLNPTLTAGTSNPISANGKYRVPADNPFVAVAGLDEIFAYGVRNPYSFGFDSGGRLIVGDVGQNNLEEINSVTRGGNYGWNLKEGTFRFLSATGQVTDFLGGLPAGLIDPVLQYDHDEGLAVIGGYVYRGAALPALQRLYVFGDFTRSFLGPQGRLFVADLDLKTIEELTIGSTDRSLGLFVKGMGRDNSGELYVLASSNLGPYGTGGVVLKIVPVCGQDFPGDVNGDCKVNLDDFALMAADWLKCSDRLPGACL